MDDDKLRPVVPDGTYLAWSRTNSDRKRALLFDNETHQLIGPAELEYVDDDYSHGGGTDYEPSPPMTPEEIQAEQEAAALLVIAVVAAAVAAVYLTAVAVKKAAPPIVRWWNTWLVPGLQMNWQRIFERFRPEDVPLTKQEIATMSPDPQRNFPVVIDDVIERHRRSMSSEEAQKRLLAIFMAGGIIAEQMRALADAQIKDSDLRAVKTAMEKLTARDVTDEISKMLESYPELLDRQTQTEFVRLFGPGEIRDDVYLPLTNDAARGALRLPGDDDPDEPRSLTRA